MSKVRLRFAPSPTGPLHIGGVRTALYNYLFSKKNSGVLVLRIEDTDQGRYVSGAEDYIEEALAWCGIHFDESPSQGGNYGPYRQSERKELYQEYAKKLVEQGHAYYAFDTPEELDQMRADLAEQGIHAAKYNYETRGQMRNSLTLPEDETNRLLSIGDKVTIRLKIPQDQEVTINDIVRGDVTFQTNELDDKIIMKADGMPTYHLANIVDDHLMEISHVVRGEEWLSSTSHHLLMYQFLGWKAPQYAHIPLILKPTGKGKLSKRDGAKFGFPVFPLSWTGADPGDSFEGFREAGFLPDALLNFLVLLGWNPGTEQEMFSMEELIEAFSLENIVK
jgi:glutamyl-tRNA synthetase